jgi:outer membrane protein assembly factor BamB
MELPLQWSDDKNILWRSEILGYGQSTSVIYDDSIFTTSTIGEQSEELIISCHSLQEGSLKWEKRFPAPVKIKRSQYVSQAAPSPVVDKDYVYCFFESGLLLALDHAGDLKWKRILTKEYGPFEGNHGLGSSLFQSNSGLGLLIEHAGPSYLLKLDKKTGRNSWKVDRNKRISWSTPTLYANEDSELLYISSNGIVECVDFVNGKTIWKEDGLEGNTVASPAFNKKIVVVGSSKPGHTIALRHEVAEGNQSQVEWVAEDASCSFGSPLVTEKFVYLVNRAGVATCHEIKNGKKLWDLRLPGSCWASPLHSPGRVYFFTKDGVTVVIKNDGSKKVLSENKVSIEGRIYGVAAVNRSFVVRTGSELLCISNQKNN